MRELNVLVIDKQVANRRACAAAFSTLGCRVAMAATGKQALTPFAARRFDIVLLDPRDPCADEILARLAPDQFAAAWCSDQTPLSARFNGVLVKPINPLVAAVMVAVTRMAAGGPQSEPELPELSAAA